MAASSEWAYRVGPRGPYWYCEVPTSPNTYYSVTSTTYITTYISASSSYPGSSNQPFYPLYNSTTAGSSS